MMPASSAQRQCALCPRRTFMSLSPLRWPRFEAVALLAIVAAFAVPARAQDRSVSAPTAHARIGIERIRLPGDEHVGLLGTSYLVDAPSIPGLAFGPAVYGEILCRCWRFFTIRCA